MWEKVKAYEQEHEMFREGDTVVLGLSGGADSICLARYLLDRRRTEKLHLIAVHVNHNLRGTEADRDEEFVKRFCERWQLPLKVFREDVAAVAARTGTSLEEAGRTVRYDCFHQVIEEEREKGGVRVRLAVAHHADDLAETVLFRILRGTGPAGLRSIRPVWGDTVRPLLCLRKTEICQILQELGQDFVEDSTNQEEDYSRNYIRHRLLPDMEHINTRATEHLCQLAEQAGELMDYVKPGLEADCARCIREKKTGWLLSEKAFAQLHPFAKKEAVRQLLFRAAGREKDITAVHISQMLSLMEKDWGKQISLPYGLTALRTEEGIFVSMSAILEDSVLLKNAQKRNGASWEKEVELPEWEPGKTWQVAMGNDVVAEFRYEEYDGYPIEKKDCVKYFDYGTIKCKLCLRTRREGDYLVINREGQHKLLKRYFIDEKISREQRDQTLLLAEGSHILWVLGGRISEACRVKEKTRRLLVVTILSGQKVR